MKRIKALPKPAPRAADSHKGDFGRVIVVGGSTGMAGAPCLCGLAALRSGAGLVTVAVPQSLYPIVAAKLTECMTHPLPESDGGINLAKAKDFMAVLRSADVIALGPGLGRSAAAFDSARRLFYELDRPMVVDADALNALAAGSNRLAPVPASRILTPHPGEMARLIGVENAAAVQKDRAGAAITASQRYQAVVVLKGAGTYVTDGRQYYENTTGNPGMATGGTGDVLTGIIAGLLAQGMAPFAAAQLGVYVHGLAGDIASDRLGEMSLIAGDLIETLPDALRSVVA